MLLPLFDRNPTSRFPWLTILLIVTNLAVAGWTASLPEGDAIDLFYEYGFVPKRLTQMESGKPLDVERQVGQLQVRARLATDQASVYRSLATMMFLHGGWLHVLSNMWMLWIFGNNVEDRLGHFVFAGYYLLGGALASGCQWAIDPASDMPVVGASGAVWAILGGYAVTFPKAKVLTLVFIGVPLLLNLPSLLVIALWFGADLIAGLWMLQGMPAQPIAHWAHVGGCVAGVVMMPLLSIGASPPDADWRSEAQAMLPDPGGRETLIQADSPPP